MGKLDQGFQILLYLTEHLERLLADNQQLPRDLLETLHLKLIEMQGPLADLQTVAEQVPMGIYTVEGNQLHASIYGKEGKTKHHTVTFPDRKPPKIYGPETEPLTFRREAFDVTPYVTVGFVGWTALTPATLENEGLDLSILSETEKKKALQNAYTDAFKKFWQPVFDYLIEAGLDKERIAMIGSPSYAGIDQIVLDYAHENDVQLGTVTPYRYIPYMQAEPPKAFPLLIENTVDDYGTAFSEVSDITVCTGGRKHSWMIDFKNQFVGNRKPVVPVDLLKRH